ncbi:hypothetical protein QR680_004186 [Steinernema hermaphroditum]|uniref:Anaphase-promoting complex subunit 1 n=1 Tax=Steinernema hermaphroditum TaxID=289476 RepID=A0AA39LTL2_9BILA|nr:hypothetical protein QR680_004186 [Steinernema hermaphroditum]
MPVIYPKWIEPVALGATRKKGIDADVKDRSRLKRIRRVCTGEVYRLTAIGQEAVVTLEPCGDLVRSYKTDFYIIDAFWHTFHIDGKPEEFLCLFGPNAIEFHSVVGNKNHPFPLMITINAAFSTKQGILLQRSPQENERGVNVHVYALTNPLNELTPVVVTGRGGFDPHFAFSGIGTEIVGASEAGGYVLVHDLESGQEQLFMVRPCNKTERGMPKNYNSEETYYSGFDLASIMETSMCNHSPGMSSIFSQNSASRASVHNGNGSFLKSSVMSDTPVTFRTPVQARALYSGGRRGMMRKFDGNMEHSFCAKTPVTPLTQGAVRSVSRQELASEVLDMMPHTSTPYTRRGRPTPRGHDRSIFQYSGTPRVWRNTSALSDLIDEADQAFSLDPMAEVCLEQIWIDENPNYTREHRRQMHEKIFTTGDMRGYNYIVLMDRESQVARLLRLEDQSRGGISNYRLKPEYIKCFDCAQVLDRTALFVWELSPREQFALYSGSTKLAHIGIVNCDSYEKEIRYKKVSRLESIDGCEVLITTMDEAAYVCHLPEYCGSRICSDALKKILQNIPNDLRLTFLSKWYCQNNWRFVENVQLMANEPNAEILLLFEHLFSLCGFSPNHIPFFDQLREARSCVTESTSAKKARNLRGVDVTVANYERLLKNRGCMVDHDQLLAEATEKEIRPEDKDRILMRVVVKREAAQDMMESNALAAFQALHNVFESLRIDIRFRSIEDMVVSCLSAVSGVYGLREYTKYYEEQLPVVKRYDFIVEGDLLREEETNACCEELHMFPVFSAEDYLQNLFSFDENLNPFPSKTTWDVKLFTALAAGLGRIRLADFSKYLGSHWMEKLELKADDIPALELANAGNDAKTRVKLFHALRTACRLPTHTAEYLVLPLWRAMTDLFRNEQDLGLCPNANPKLRVPPSLDVQGIWAGRRFRHDLRLDNVAVMLDSQFQTLIPMKPRPNQVEGDFREEQEQFLLSCSLRTLSQAFGRACVIYHCTPVSMDLKLHVSSLCLTGRGYPYNRVIEINSADMDISKMIDWGHYYNGVSHGLSLMGSEHISYDPMWLGLCYARQRDAITGAGVVYAFGLSGHINLINMYTIHEWLARGDNYLVVSILLGSAITSRGSCDINVHKMVTTHLPFMLPTTLLELHINPLVQCAALFSLGMLFAESKHESLTSQIINEMGRPVGDNHPMEHRGTYYMCGGFAVGLINLGKGPQLRYAGTANRCSLVSRLLQLMHGGKRSDIVFPNEKYDVKALVGHVHENDRANIHVTGLPATIALGLLFIRTNDEFVHKCLEIPNNMTSIREIRYDFLCARTVSRMLIEFDNITPTMEYIYKNIPPVVLEPVQAILEQRHEDWINSKHRETGCTAYLYIVGGACFVMGLRFASTRDERMFAVLQDILKLLLPGIRVPGGQLLCKAAGYPAYVHCLNAVLTSIALVMAGSANIDAIRIFRNIRNIKPKIYEHKHSLIHSTYQIAHIGLGMLFMGYGRYAFGTSNMDVAALLISMYPVVSMSVADNRVYLQPLRFLWCIAAKLRLLVPVRTQTMKPVDATCIIRYRYLGRLREAVHQTPYMLPDFKDITEIRLEADGYEKETFKFATEEDRNKFVKEFTQQHGRIHMRPVRRPVQRVVKGIEDCQGLRKGMNKDHGEVLRIAQDDLRALEDQLGSLPVPIGDENFLDEIC